MAGIVAHARAQNETDQRVSRLMNGDERGFGIEYATARKAHDVVQKTQRPGVGAVLVVNLGVDVGAIRSRDDASRRLKIGFNPTTNLNLARHFAPHLNSRS